LASEAGLGTARLRPGKPYANFSNNCGSWQMKYVYILECIDDPERHYSGITDDLKARVKAHNSGKVYHTAKFKPWRLNTYIAFRDADRAIAFEKYLKSHSGRAFAAKRL